MTEAQYIFRGLKVPTPGGGFKVVPGPMEELPSELTTGEFARLVGISESRVRGLCDEGLIQWRRRTLAKNSQKLIPRSEVARFMSNRE